MTTTEDDITLFNLITSRTQRTYRNPTQVLNVFKAIQQNPHEGATKQAKRADVPEQTFYKLKRQLKEAGLLNERTYASSLHVYPLPTNMLNKIMPPENSCPHVHLAAYLTKFKEDEIVPGYKLTRGEICKIINKKYQEDITLATEFYNSLYDNLALAAIISGKLGIFEDVKGNIMPPGELPT